MLNFTVGPVMSNPEVRQIGAEQVPYFRTEEFSKVMLENEQLVKKFAQAEKAARVVFLTGSGTASMEAVVINVLTPKDKALVINGGSFGQRFVELCKIHGVSHKEVIPSPGESVSLPQLEKFEGLGFTALLVNVHETSTGVLHDIRLISQFCKKNGLLLIVDAISSFLADDLAMSELGVDVMIAGSQKALACPPGVSLIVLSERALNRVEKNEAHSMYLDLRVALTNQERGQTPFTPAVGILLQIHSRLISIEKAGGVESEIRRVASLAADFRKKVSDFPFKFTSKRMSNAVTPLHPLKGSAYDLFLKLKDEYGIWICPNGGELRNTVFRVGHLGALSVQDNDTLISAFHSLIEDGIL